MSNMAKFLMPILILGLATAGGRYVYYKILNAGDRSDRPWAYPDDQGNPLTGSWVGEVKDADGQVHHLELNIVNPFDDASRAERLTNRKLKRDRHKKTSFEFTATERYQSKVIEHQNLGSLAEPEGEDVKWQFGPIDDKHYPGFNLNLAKGKWNGDKILMEVSFSFYTPEGHSHYESADPRHRFKGTLVLQKKT
jgi:hypothetical protein